MDWKSSFTKTILTRGREYYFKGKVGDVHKIHNGFYRAEIRGSRRYRTEIMVNSNGRLIMNCTCPYDSRCKHQAAMLYKMDDEIGIDKIIDDMNEKPKRIKPFGKTKKYQYFELEKITKDIDFDEEKCKKARELIDSRNVVLDEVLICFDDKNKQNLIIEGRIVEKKFDQTIKIRMNSDRIIQMICYGKGCNFYYGGFNRSVCVHQIALLYLLYDKMNEQTIGDATDYDAVVLLNEYRGKRIAAGKAEAKANTEYYLEPRLGLSYGKLNLSFRIGEKKLYVMKNIESYISAVEEKKTMKLGTKNEIDFAVSVINPEQKELYDFIKSVVQDERHILMEDDYHYRYGNYDKGMSNISLYGDRLDRFFEIYYGKKVICKCEYNGEENMIMLRDEKPECVLNIDSYSSDEMFHGIRLTGNLPKIYEGNKAGYFIDENYFNRFSQEEMKKLAPLQRMTNNGRIDIKIGRNYITDFYRKVLPMLEDVVEIRENNSEEISAHIPPDAEFKFYLDAEDNDILCKISSVYGENGYSVKDIITGENITIPQLAESGRDVEKENYVIEEVQRYLPVYRAETDEFHCDGDENLEYEFLRNGVDRLLELGEVQSTDKFKRITIKNKVNVSVGVSVESDLLNLEVTSDEYSKEELLEILGSYRKKKKYHRLRSGAFVNLDSEAVSTLAELYEQMHITPKQFIKDKIKIPAYRALYLDKMLEEKNDIYTKRDKNFKKLINEFKTVNSSDFEIPDRLQKIMRNYQKYGYRWIRTLMAYGFGGILADDMGLGKTLQMISVLLAAKEEGIEGTSLVVCPASLVFNWQEEFIRFAPDINVAVIVGNPAERKSLLEKYSEYDVIITSYDLLKRDIDVYEGKQFFCQVIDEAQYIKNHTTAVAKSVKIIEAKKKYALTGTPIENRLSELWSIFDYLMPGYLFSYEDFKKNYETKIVKNRDNTTMSALKRMVAPFILRRIKEDVLKDLPEKLEEIRYTRFESKQKVLYDGQVTKLKAMLDSGDDESIGKDKIKILAEIMKLRQICCDPSLIFEDYDGESVKTDATIELIESAIESGHRMLVFSQFTSMLDILKKRLDEKNIEYYVITGETKKEERIHLVKQFNEGGVPVFLISLKAGGTGLNLVGADVVVHFDPWWNLAVQNQATDRAHRIGQTKKVSVYKMIVKDSIEEKIVKMQEQKKNLADEILSGEMGGIGSMSKEELLELLN